MEMNYCMHCGTRLRMREHETEGLTPWCETCGQYRYPVFNTAVSMIVMNREHTKVILIRQYGKPYNVLVAGYVSCGEDAEDTVKREVFEEIGMTVLDMHFNRSHYYAPSNTLMLNFTVTVSEDEAHPNWEVDSWRWFSIEEAEKAIKPGSLAEAFLKGYFSGHYELPEIPPTQNTL